MNRNARIWRIAAGSLALLALGVFAARLVPLYFRNLELQQFLEETVEQRANSGAPEDLVRITVVNKAAELGLPVKTNEVKVLRSEGRMRIEVLYMVPADFWLYAVDLHFHAEAGGI